MNLLASKPTTRLWNCLFPKMAKGSMDFYYCHSFDELLPNKKGIFEPTSSQLATGKEALLLLPAVVADRNGYRIGYGGGYYDKYLAMHTELTSKFSFL
jgi:5-formyltetrahydrofolate cyclo-ligase